MNRRTDETDDSKLSDEITEHRDAALSFIAQTLSRALADNKPVPAGLNLRHPDFARFAVKIGRAIGREEQIVSALQIAEKDKSLFCLENDFIGAAVLDYLDETGTFTGTAAELRTKLSERDLGFIRKDRPSAKGVGKRLRTLWPHFENILTVARQEEDRNHFKIYTLKSKSADFADFV